MRRHRISHRRGLLRATKTKRASRHDESRPAWLAAVFDHLEAITVLLAGKRGDPQIVENEEIDPRQRLNEPRKAFAAAGKQKPSW